MKDIFGGKLTAGIFAMVGLFIGVIAAGIMAGPFGQLGSYFSDSAQFKSGTHEGTTFSRAYTSVTGDAEPSATQINTDTNRAGGAGFPLVQGASYVGFTNTSGASITATTILYNEQGQSLGFPAVVGTPGTAAACADNAACALVNSTASGSIKWRTPPEAFSTLSFLNTIMVGILALMAAIGLIMRTKDAYSAFQTGGMTGLDGTVLSEISTLVLGLVAVYFAPPLLNIMGDTATVYISGQYDFSFVGSILKIVFSVVPTILMIGVMALLVGPGSALKAVKGGFSSARGMGSRRFGRRRMAY